MTPVAGPALALTSDVLWARTSSEKTDDLKAWDADVTRLRLGLEGSWRIAMEGDAHLTPKLAASARHDGGDAETGFGVEVGGGLAWTDPVPGLILDVWGRTLLAHENGDLKDWGNNAQAARSAFAPEALQCPVRPYTVFARMLARGNSPDDWTSLMTASRQDWQSGR